MAKPEKILKKIKKVENIVNNDNGIEELISVSRKIRKINEEIIKDIDDILKNNLT